MASCQSCPSKESDYLDAYTANALLSSNSPVQAHCSSGSTLFCFADPILQSSLFCGCSIDHSNYANMQRVKYSSSLYAEEDASCVWQLVNASPGHDPGSVAGTWEMGSTHFEYQFPDPRASEELLCLPSTQMHDLCSEVLRNDGGRQFRDLTHSSLFPSSDVDMASCSNDSATKECVSGPPEAKMMVTVCSNLVVPKVSSSIGARDDLLIDMEKTAGFNYPSTSQSSYEFGPPVHNFGSAELPRVVHSQSQCSTNFSFDPFFVQVESSVLHHTIGIENLSAPVLNHERSAIQTVDDHSNVVKCLSRTFSCSSGLSAPVHDSWATPISTDRHSALQSPDDGQKRPHVALSVLPSASSNVAESKLCRSIKYPLQSRRPNELHQACSSPQQLESLERENRELSSSSDIGKNFRTCDDRVKSRKTALRKNDSATVLLPITDGKEMIIGCADKRPKRCKIEDMILEECVTSLNEEKRCRGSSKPATTSRKRTRDHAKLGLEIPKDVIHVRARRGQATDSHSLAERVRREKISQRMRVLQELVPGCHKVHGKAVMLDVIINYVQSLQQQVEFLSMRLAAASPMIDGCVSTKQKTMEISQCELASLFDLLLNSFSSIQP